MIFGSDSNMNFNSISDISKLKQNTKQAAGLGVTSRRPYGLKYS